MLPNSFRPRFGTGRCTNSRCVGWIILEYVYQTGNMVSILPWYGLRNLSYLLHIKFRTPLYGGPIQRYAWTHPRLAPVCVMPLESTLNLPRDNAIPKVVLMPPWNWKGAPGRTEKWSVVLARIWRLLISNNCLERGKVREFDEKLLLMEQGKIVCCYQQGWKSNQKGKEKL